MKTLVIVLSFLYLTTDSSFAAGSARCKGKGQGQGQGQQQQCQQQQQQQEQDKDGVCAPLAKACIEAGYTGSSAGRCVDNILADRENEINVYFGDKVACNNFKNSNPAAYQALKNSL